MFPIPTHDETILAVDPGVTTGMALVNARTGSVLEAWIIEDQTDVIRQVGMAWGKNCHVVVEDFVGSGPRTKEAIFVLKLVGGIGATCQLGGVSCTFQNPQARIPFIPEAKARVPKGVSKHAVDAYAHCLAFIERRKIAHSK